MIDGRVSSAGRALIPLSLRDDNGAWHTIQFVLDTGFTGYLALPERYVRQLGLTLNAWRHGITATGIPARFPAGYARLLWRGHPLEVTVIQTGNHPLLGMSLLWRHHIAIDAVADGAVAITPYEYGGSI